MIIRQSCNVSEWGRPVKDYTSEPKAHVMAHSPMDFLFHQVKRLALYLLCSHHGHLPWWTVCTQKMQVLFHHGTSAVVWDEGRVKASHPHPCHLNSSYSLSTVFPSPIRLISYLCLTEVAPLHMFTTNLTQLKHRNINPTHILITSFFFFYLAQRLYSAPFCQ